MIQAERGRLESITKALTTVEIRRSKLSEELDKCNFKAEELEKQKVRHPAAPCPSAGGDRPPLTQATAAGAIARLQAEAQNQRDEKLRAASTSLPSLGPSPLPPRGGPPPHDAPPAADTSAAPPQPPPDLLNPAAEKEPIDLLGTSVDVAPSAAASNDLLGDDPLIDRDPEVGASALAPSPPSLRHTSSEPSPPWHRSTCATMVLWEAAREAA